MNMKIRGRLWQLLWEWRPWKWGFVWGETYSPRAYIFKWWIVGPLEVRRFVTDEEIDAKFAEIKAKREQAT